MIKQSFPINSVSWGGANEEKRRKLAECSNHFGKNFINTLLMKMSLVVLTLNKYL